MEMTAAKLCNFGDKQSSKHKIVSDSQNIQIFSIAIFHGLALFSLFDSLAPAEQI